MSIFVQLELQAKEGSADAMIEILRRTLVDTRARQGCEGVTVHQDHDHPTKILLVERWATREDDDAYRAWRAGDGATPEIVPHIAAAPIVRYFDNIDA